MPKIINRIIKFLMVSDFFLNLGWGLLAPIFALFILQNITVENTTQAVEVAGWAALFYWISKSFMEIPIGHFLDKRKGERDDYWFMVIGLFIVAFVPLGFLVSTRPAHIYILQVLHATGMAMTLPSWLAIFTRHIDKEREAFEWGVESTSISAGAGIAGGLGGIMAAKFGFGVIFIFASILTFFSAFLLLLIRKDVSSRTGGRAVVSPERPTVEP